jgi:hypothetical protein
MFVSSFSSETGVLDRRLPLFIWALRKLRPSDADGLIVRKLPEFVKKNHLALRDFQRLVKILTATWFK